MQHLKTALPGLCWSPISFQLGLDSDLNLPTERYEGEHRLYTFRGILAPSNDILLGPQCFVL